MKVYRIVLTRYCDTSGEGARLYGGRWNLPGTPAIYAGSNLSSSLLERLTIDPELFSSERYILYSVMEILVPNESIVIPKEEELPLDWNKIPSVKASQKFGTALMNAGVLCFAVPSVVDPSSLNYVINPLAELFHQLDIKIHPLELDRRIIR